MRAGVIASLALCACDGVFGIIEVQKLPDAQVTSVDAVIEPSLVAWYRLDEGTGPTYADSSGHRHDGGCGSATCPIGVVGHIATGASFDGLNDYIEVPSAPELQGTFTVALWLYLSRLPPAGSCAISKLLGNANANSWQACIYSSGAVAFYTSEGSLHQWHRCRPATIDKRQL